ncbi:glycosyltransferase [Photobacterium sp. GJ3]|uniref:glycosyltransferase n=1 Tax=Photobacterium sp. GJ3 TaxID=2829502 RepID=UPI001B8C56BE|nr:glycosyltransferase [Photobacterium sp. GJ3]QUJ68207.1 glycosyltransferase [Photobacterium sp. GJ3]
MASKFNLLEMDYTKSMKCVFFINTINRGGSEQYVYSLAKQLKEKKSAEIVIISSNGVMAEFLRECGYKVVLIPFVGINADRVSDLPIKHRLFYRNWFWLKFFYRAYLGQYVKGADFFISQQGYPTIVASALLRAVPHINIVHHILPNEYTSIYNELNINPNKFVAVSEEVRDFLASKGVYNSEVIQNPIDIPNLAQDEISESKKHNIVLLSHLHEEKRSTIESFLGFVEKADIEEYSFTVIGDISSAYASEIYTRYNHIVRFTGSLARDELLIELNHADCVIAVGRSALEALLLKKKVIMAGHIIGKNGGNFGGLLTSENITEAAYYNYSGRHAKDITSKDKIASCIQESQIISPNEIEIIVRELESRHLPNIVMNKFLSVVDDVRKEI